MLVHIRPRSPLLRCDVLILRRIGHRVVLVEVVAATVVVDVGRRATSRQFVALREAVICGQRIAVQAHALLTGERLGLLRRGRALVGEFEVRLGVFASGMYYFALRRGWRILL